MKVKHSVMIGMLGRIFDRFHEYQPHRDLQQQIELAQQVQGMDGIEIVYPNHFAKIDDTVELVKENGLILSALNLDLKGCKKWQSGSLTAANPALRRQAINEMKIAMDLAAELGTDMVTCCPLIDGHNYNFEVDYLKQWGWLEEGIREGASHRSDIRLSLEYKMSESRNFNILADAGRTLYLCERLGLPNVGITFDVGHALIAEETPAEVMTIAALEDRLFYVHFNDNNRGWDWDMLPGSVNFWDLIEVVYYLDRLNWEGWLSYDIVTRNGDLVESMEASIGIVEAAIRLVNKFGGEQLQACIEDGTPARTFLQLTKALL